MKKSTAADYDIIIVGAGPAGLSFARSLAGTGLKIAVVEKLSTDVLTNPPMDGRDIALTHFSVKLLKELDVWRRLPGDSISMIKEARVVNGTSPYFLHFDHRDTNKDTLGFLVSNHLIRKAVFEALDGFSNVTLISGVEVTAAMTNDAGGCVHLSNGKTLEGSLVIAADSRFSATRRNIGISASMQDFGRVAVVCQMEHEKPHNDIAFECFHYGQTLAILPLTGNKSSIVITLPAGLSEEVMEMDETVFNNEIQRRFDNRLGKMNLVGKLYAYPLVAVYANKFVTTRFALIGDAAVGMHPVTAHGFNLGLRSAHTLAAEIKTSLNRGGDIGSNELLERYQTKHRRASLPLYLATNAIVGLYTNEILPARILRKTMLRLGNHIWPVKRAIMNLLTESKL